MKLNWGSGIFIFLVIFFISIAVFLYIAFDNDIELVEDDYYPKELVYQQQIDKKDNLKQLGEEITLQKSKDFISLQFPKSQIQDSLFGQLIIYRPSDSDLDKNIRIKLDSNNIHYISTSHFIPGKYVLKIAWSYKQKAYYQEITLIY